MNKRASLNLLILLITLIISSFFIISNSLLSFINQLEPCLFITLTILILLIELKPNSNHHKKIYQTTLLISISSNIILFLYLLTLSLKEYITYGIPTINSSFYYFLILYSSFLITCFDLKKETSTTNDVLTILTSLTILFIHYRFYLDKNLLHNIVSATSDSFFQKNIYITQYYPYFMLMYLILIINKKINSIH